MMEKDKKSGQSKRSAKYGLFSMVGHTIGLGMKKRPLLPPLFLLIYIGMGIAATANTFVKQLFFESIEGLVAGRVQYAVVVGYGILMCLFPAFILAVRTGNNAIVMTFYGVTLGYMGEQLNAKAARVDPLVYEDNRFLDQINKAYVGLEASRDLAINCVYVVANQCVYLISMAVYLFTVKPALLLMFGISFVPNIIGTMVRKRRYAKREHKAAPYRRRYEYFEKCLCSREYVKETRLWSSEGFFRKMYGHNISEYAKLDWETSRHVGLVELGLRFLQLTGYVGTIVMLFYFMFQGEVSVGIFAAVFTSLDELFGQMNELFQGEINVISRNYGAAQNYFNFMNLPERQGLSEESLKRDRIELKGVSFTYPNSEKPALSDIDLTVHKGETIAIVGVNGSGKSTLTRLLTGLYLPTSGELLIDGRDASDIAPKTLYEGVSAVFQRYQSYKMTVAENTRISEMEKRAGAFGEQAAMGKAENVTKETAGKIMAKAVEKGGSGTAENAAQEAAVRDVLEKADFPLDSEKLTEGLDTMLGKYFGCIDLSGGQWQRLAIARGLYRDHDMIILDEPTAAIDPLQEADIYHKFAQISKDKTAFIVTHRLGSAQIADRIIVMDAGHIVDMGTHEELMQREGKYREMYQAQAKWYR